MGAQALQPRSADVRDVLHGRAHRQVRPRCVGGGVVVDVGRDAAAELLGRVPVRCLWPAVVRGGRDGADSAVCDGRD